MALLLDDPALEKLAHEVARLEGTSVSDAIHAALAARRQELLDVREEKRREIKAIIAEIHALPVLDDRPPDEMLYDEDGIPK
jgi:antitoxin VapB